MTKNTHTYDSDCPMKECSAIECKGFPLQSDIDKAALNDFFENQVAMDLQK